MQGNEGVKQFRFAVFVVQHDVITHRLYATP